MDGNPRVLMVADSKGHTTGYYVVARALRDAGFEVILGGYLTPEEIVETALQEDVGCIGQRIMDRDPLAVVEPLMRLLAERGLRDVPVMVGGIIPPPVVTQLRRLGVGAVFRPGARLDDIVEYVRLSARSA